MFALNWLRRYGDTFRSAVALSSLLALVAGGAIWTYRVETRIEQLQGQVQFLLSVPSGHGERRSNESSNSRAAVCVNLAKELADAYTVENFHAENGINEMLDQFACKTKPFN